MRIREVQTERYLMDAFGLLYELPSMVYAGWGGLWRNSDVAAGEVSDPFLMTGFDRKVLHLGNDGDAPVTLEIEVDPLGDGVFRLYRAIDVPARGYLPHVFPEGFSAHWLRLRTRQAGRLTAELIYS